LEKCDTWQGEKVGNWSTLIPRRREREGKSTDGTCPGMGGRGSFAPKLRGEDRFADISSEKRAVEGVGGGKVK